MARTLITSKQIDRFCRVPGLDGFVLVVLSRGRRFRFCDGRTFLRENQCVLEPSQELDPAAFLERYGDKLPNPARIRLANPPRTRWQRLMED